VDTEQEFDLEFTVDELTKTIVDNIKSDVKNKYGNKKRHKQW
jgi:cell fate (sporulation/competence/biofilm development) regulator YlbF (YheA/YmcA/DUF963 family)